MVERETPKCLAMFLSGILCFRRQSLKAVAKLAWTSQWNFGFLGTGRALSNFLSQVKDLYGVPCPHHSPTEGHGQHTRTPPKSSPKRIAAKKVRESPPPRLSFSARLLRIHALGVRKHRNLLIGRHLPTSAFYSAVFQNALAGAL